MDPDETHRRSRDLRRDSLVHDLARRLAHGDPLAKVCAAREVRKAARASSKTRAALGVVGVVQPLVEMVEGGEFVAVEAAVVAVLNLAARNDRNKDTIVMLGAVPPLVELLKSINSRLRELATAAILSLSTSTPNRSIIIASGAAKLLVQVLISGSIQGRVDAVTALYNLFTSQETLDPRLYVESIFPLLSLLKDSKKCSKFAEKATALLEILSQSEEGRNAISEVEGGILTIVETVEDGSSLSVDYAAGILLNLCRSCRERYRVLILHEGAIPGLLVLTVYGTERAKKRAKALLKLLRNDRKPMRVSSEVLETLICTLPVK